MELKRKVYDCQLEMWSRRLFQQEKQYFFFKVGQIGKKKLIVVLFIWIIINNIKLGWKGILGLDFV